jgi:hypothetical protein
VPRTLRGLPAERLDAPRLHRGVERPTGGQADHRRDRPRGHGLAG